MPLGPFPYGLPEVREPARRPVPPVLVEILPVTNEFARNDENEGCDDDMRQCAQGCHGYPFPLGGVFSDFARANDQARSVPIATCCNN